MPNVRLPATPVQAAAGELDTPMRAPSPTITPVVSVVVATCGRPRQLRRCVETLLESDYPDFEIVVVDNTPPNRSPSVPVADQIGDHDQVRCLVEPRRGASRARNAGIAAARGDIVAFTDDDVVVDRGWLAAIGDCFASYPEVACMTGLTLPYRLETSAQRNFERVAGFGGGDRPLRFHEGMNPTPTRLFPYTSGVVGSSNNMAVRAEVLERLGGFDVRLGPGTRVGGAEDLDLLTRILLDGGEIQYESRAMVWHEHRESDHAVENQLFSYGSGATAMLTKWAFRSPQLRRQVARHAWTILGDLGRHEVVRQTVTPGTSSPERLPSTLRRARILGYMCGPALWLYEAVQGDRKA